MCSAQVEDVKCQSINISLIARKFCKYKFDAINIKSIDLLLRKILKRLKIRMCLRSMLLLLWGNSYGRTIYKTGMECLRAVATQIKVINVRNSALLSTRGKFSCCRFSLSHECQKEHVLNRAEKLQFDKKSPK